MFKRRRAGLVVLALAAAAVFVLPAGSASAATFTNGCINSVTTNKSQIDVTMSANAPGSVKAGKPVTLTNINQSLAVPGSIFVSGYRIFLYGTGPLTVPATVTTVIEGTNTVQGTQATNTVSATISTTISDPTPANRNSGDESATPGQLNVTYANQTWTAGASGKINFREDTVTPLSGAPTSAGGIVINAVIGGAIPVEFDCSPGTVDTSTVPEGIITFIDPAVPFANTQIAKKCKKGFKLKTIKKKGKKPTKKCVKVKKKKKK